MALGVALEFALAADVLRDAMAPSWDETGKLAAIAALRTVLNFFLQREVADEAAARRHGGGAPARRGVSPARPHTGHAVLR